MFCQKKKNFNITCFYPSEGEGLDSIHTSRQGILGPYFKRKRELKSNSSKILLINCKFICILIICLKSQT